MLCLRIASASVVPLSTSSLTVVMARRKGFESVWAARMERHCTMGSPASIMVANCRVKTTMSRAFTGEPKLGTGMSKSSPLPFSLMRDGCGWMRWLRRRMITASRLDASISPLSVSPLGDTPCHR